MLLKILNDVFASLSKDVVSNDNSDYPKVQATLEMKVNLKEESTEEAPLEWWKKNTFHYPLLSTVM